jgi:hypothetical protein
LKIEPDKPKRRATLRLGYGVLAPIVTVIAVYLFVFLATNSHFGSDWIKKRVNEALPGSIDFEYVEIQPSLNRVHAWGLQFFDTTGQPVIEVRRAECSIDLTGMLFNRYELNRCEASDGQVLVGVKPDGHLGIVRTFSPRERSKSARKARPDLIFDGVTIEDVDVLVNLNNLMLRFDDAQTQDAFITVDEKGFYMETERLMATGGRWVFSPRLLGFGSGKSNLATLAWSALRMVDPWKAAHTDYPEPAEDSRGPLDVPLHSLDLRGLEWEREWIEFDEGYVRAADVTVAGSAWLQFIPEQPRLAPGESGVLSYDGEATLHFTPDSPVLDFFLPGVVSTAEDGHAESAIKPLQFDGYGNIRIFDGSTELHAEELNVFGWQLDRFDGNIGIRAGRLGIDGIAEAELWGGMVSGKGWIEPSNGAWSADLCLRNVRLERFLGAFPTLELPDDVRNARVRTIPSRCNDAFDAPIEMSGNLTSKALFQMDPARETRADNFIEDTMWRMDLERLQITWDERPIRMPGRQVLLSGSARLDQRGYVHVPAEVGQQPLVVRADEDTARFEGVVDIIRGQFEDAVVDLQTGETSLWAEAYWLPKFPKGVTLDSRLELSGSVFNPMLEGGRLEIQRDVTDASSPAFSFQAGLERDGLRHRIEEFKIDSEAGTVDVTGFLTLFANGIFQRMTNPSGELEVRVRDLNLDMLPVDLPISTRITAFDGTWSGTLANPEATADLKTSDGFIAGEPFDSIETSARWDGRVLDVEGFRLRKGSGDILGDVSINTREKSVSGQFSGNNFRLSDLQTLVAAGVSPDGIAKFSLHLDGTLRRPDIYGSVVVERLRMLDRRIGTTSFVIDTWENTVHATGTFNGLVDTELRYQHGGDEIQVASTFQRLPLGRLLPSIEGGFARSWLSGQVHTTVQPGSPVNVQSDIVVSEAHLNAEERVFHLEEPAVAEVDFDGSGYSYEVKPFAISDGERQLVASGSRSSGGALDASLRGEVDLALLQLFPDLIADASGTARVDATIRGLVGELTTEGSVGVDDIQITPRGLGTTLRVDSGSFELLGDRVVIPDERPIRGEIYGGDLILSGVAEFADLQLGELVLNANFSGATYRIPDQLVMTLNGALQITNEDLASPRGWAVGGNVEIVDGRYYRDFDIFSDLFSIGGIGRTVSQFESPIWIENPDVGAIDLDLSVTGRDRLFIVSSISNAELDLEMKTDLSITGPLAEMDVEGEMEMLEDSRVLYSGRRFDVGDGVFLFTGYRDDQGIPWPQIDMEMETELRSTCTSRRRGTLDTTASEDLVGQRVEESQSIFITVDVEGRLPVDLTFGLDSTPFYDQRDQLALILTGCPVDALTGGSGAAPTLEIVFRPVIDIVERNVEDRFNLDDVDLVPTPEGNAEILVEDEVSERLIWTLNARVGTDEETEQTVTGRYSLFDWMILELLEQTGREQPLTIDGGIRFRVRLN